MFDAIMYGSVPRALLRLKDVLTSTVSGALRREDFEARSRPEAQPVREYDESPTSGDEEIMRRILQHSLHDVVAMAVIARTSRKCVEAVQDREGVAE
jgi:hypothetical protein